MATYQNTRSDCKLFCEIIKTSHGFEVKIRSSSEDVFNLARCLLKYFIPADLRRFNWTHKFWVIDSVAEWDLKFWLDEVRAEFNAQVIWATSSQSQQQQSGNQHYQPPPVPKLAKLDDAYSTLNLSPGASLDAVRRARKRLALLHHPDRGGTLRRMQEINLAVETIKTYLKGKAA